MIVLLTSIYHVNFVNLLITTKTESLINDYQNSVEEGIKNAVSSSPKLV